MIMDPYDFTIPWQNKLYWALTGVVSFFEVFSRGGVNCQAANDECYGSSQSMTTAYAPFKNNTIWICLYLKVVSDWECDQEKF